MDNVKDKFASILSLIQESVPNAVFTYLLWTIVHYASAHMYIHLCVGQNVIDIVTSPLYSSAPYCQALSWTVYTISREFIPMWLYFGTYLCGRLLLNKKINVKDTDENS